MIFHVLTVALETLKVKQGIVGIQTLFPEWIVLVLYDIFPSFYTQNFGIKEGDITIRDLQGYTKLQLTICA